MQGEESGSPGLSVVLCTMGFHMLPEISGMVRV